MVAQSQQIPLIICGDFNSHPGSYPHNFVVKGSANCISEKANDPLGIYQYLKLHHSLSLASSYSSFLHSNGVEEQRRKMNSQTNEPAFTFFLDKFFSTLDYIFYTGNSPLAPAVECLEDMPIPLCSVYAFTRGEPPFTNCTPDFTNTLDYILFAPTDNIIPISLLELPELDSSDVVGGLPNYGHPSDHLPIGTEFEITRD